MSQLVPVNTAALREVIEGAVVSPGFRISFVTGLTRAGIFNADTVDPIQLGIEIGRLVVDKQVPDDIQFTTMVAAITAFDKSPDNS